MQGLEAEVYYLRTCKEIQAGEIAKLRLHLKNHPDALADAPAPEELPLAPQKMTEETLLAEAKRRVKVELPDVCFFKRATNAVRLMVMWSRL